MWQLACAAHILFQCGLGCQLLMLLKQKSPIPTNVPARQQMTTQGFEFLPHRWRPWTVFLASSFYLDY